MTIKECQKTPYNFRPDKLVQVSDRDRSSFLLSRNGFYLEPGEVPRNMCNSPDISSQVRDLKVRMFCVQNGDLLGQQNEGTPREIMTVEEKAKDRLKLVFFGPAGSGKSTLYKQCKWLFSSRY